MNKIITFLLFFAVVGQYACTDPTVIGGGLVDSSQLAISYRDDISIEMRTIEAVNNSISTRIQDTEGIVPIGCIRSAYTGDLNARVGLQVVEREEQVDLSSATIDSIVLVLPLDTSFQIGDTAAAINLRVLGATSGSFEDPLPITSTPLLDNGIVYGNVTTVPPRSMMPATVFTTDSSGSRIDTVGPEIRIQLDQAFEDALLPAIATSFARGELIDSLFVLDFPGIVIEGSDCGGTLPSIDLSLARNSRMGILIYYTEGADQRQYQLNYRRESTSFGTLRPQYVHTYVGFPAAELLVNEPLEDSLAIVQSLSGLMVKVDFPDLSSLDNKAVNAAFLEVPIIQGTERVIRALPRIIPRIGDVSNLQNYSAFAPNGSVEFDVDEGGSLIQIPDPRNISDSIFAYRFNLTSFFQNVTTNGADPILYLLPQFQTRLPGESILAGPKGSAMALKTRLLLSTTDLP